MRVLLVSDITAWDLGGIPVEKDTLARVLLGRGHDVGVATDRPDRYSYASATYPITLPAGPRASEELSSAVKLFKPDVVHLISCGPRLLMRLSTTLREVPWVITVHNVPPAERRLGGFYWNQRMHYGIRRVRYMVNDLFWRHVFSIIPIPAVVTHSPDVTQRIVQNAVRSEVVRVIPIAVSTDPEDAFSEHHGGNGLVGCEVRVATVAGIAYTKGIHDAVKAIEICRSFGVRCHYDVIGRVRQQSYLNYLHRRIRSLRLDGAVTFHLNADDEFRDSILRRAHVYLQPSHEEGFCLSFVEAMGVLSRLVGTSTGIMPVVAEGDPLIQIVAPGQPLELARAIRAVLNAKCTPGVMQDRKHRLANIANEGRYVEAHEQLYSEVIAMKRSRERRGMTTPPPGRPPRHPTPDLRR